jgi:hypothetical protein
MRGAHRITVWIWPVVIMAAVAFVGWNSAVRVAHIDAVTALAGGDAQAVDPASPTGYVGGARPLIVPVRDPRSLQWVLQAQELQARGTWRLDRVAYDNAPLGREVWSPSPYRWWLVAVGRAEAAVSGRPVGAAIERAALWADPVLHVLLVLVCVGMVWRAAGVAAAAWCAAVLAAVFPLGASFLPGRPDDLSLSLLGAVLSVLPLAVVVSAPGRRVVWAWSLAAGAAAGLGLWVNANLQILLLAATVLGGGAVAWWRRPTGELAVPGAGGVAWRVWAGAGAVVVLAGWLIERGPDRLGLAGARWDFAHPGYALMLLGCGELLVRLDARARLGRAAWTPLAIGATVLAVTAVAIPMVLGARAGLGQILGPGETLLRISDESVEIASGGVGAWFSLSGVSLAAVAAALPVLVGFAIGGALLLRSGVAASTRAGLAFVLVVASVPAAGAWFRPGDLAAVTAMLAILAVPVGLALREPGVGLGLRVGGGAAALACLATGLAVALPQGGEGASRAEVQALVERDLAWWLASQAPESGAVVLAPPDLTSALIYHGGLRGLGSPYRENEDGFRFSVRLAAASTPDEGQALVDNRGVRYIVMPSWDAFLDEYARLGANDPSKALIGLLHQWLPPRWLRAVPYQVPQVEGFAGRSVAVFQVVELQDNPTALSRLAEYFLETGQLTSARRLAAALKEIHPTEPAAFVARAQVAVASRDAGGFREIVEALLPMLEDGSAETLTWDRRVSLALVLAQAKQTEAARREAQRCLDEMDEPALRTLTNLSLQRFLGLARSLNLEFPDPELRVLALRLLPPEMRPP